MNGDVFILSAARTPMGSFCKSLGTLSAPCLGSIAIRESVKRADLTAAAIDEVIMGCVLTAGVGQAPARQAALFADLLPQTPCFTVNKVCGSGLQSVILAAQSILCGNSTTVVAGGMESMSQAPFLLEKARSGYRLGHGEMVDSMIKDGLWDVYNNFHMGNAAELCVKKYQFSRASLDEFTTESYRRAQHAMKNGFFKDEIVPVLVPSFRGGVTVKESISQDEEPYRVVFEKIPSLKPVFEKEGRITAANASTLNDGAAALVLSSGQTETAMAKITGWAAYSQEPEWFSTAPVGAIRKLLEKLNLKTEDFDLFEINEAFAAVTLSAIKDLKLDPSKVNIHGGAVAMGHPIGASGARILTTLLYALKRKKLKSGIASICIGGGEALALSIEML
ncbi:MAG: thiolase family protein [Deltaproteobacteria bacterium]|nr:thiolase family protein [Deltaproteobacteria bacterium]